MKKLRRIGVAVPLVSLLVLSGTAQGPNAKRYDQSLAALPVTMATTGGALSISAPITQNCTGVDDAVAVTVRVLRTTTSLGCAPYRMSWNDGA